MYSVARRFLSARVVVLLVTALLVTAVPLTPDGSAGPDLSFSGPAHAAKVVGSAVASATTGVVRAIGSLFDRSSSPEPAGPAALPVPDPEHSPLAREKAAAFAKAKATGKRVEVASQRTATTTVYADPDGNETAVLSAGPVRVRRGDGWVPVDTTLVPVDENDPSAGVRPRAVPFDLTIGSRTAGLVAISAPEGEIALQWPGTLPKPVLKGATATYRDVVPDGDLVIEATAGGIEQSLVLRKRPAAPVELRLPVRLRGLDLSTAAGGALTLTDARGVVRAGGAQPRMWGATRNAHSLDPVRSAPVATRVEHDGDATTLVTAPDMAFLSDPATTYPVTVDPAIGLTNGGDVWVQSDTSTNQGSSTELKTGTFDAGGTVARSLIKFSMSPILNKHVIDADFKLYEYHSFSCTARQVNVYKNASDFSTGTATWASGTPGISGAAIASANVAYGYSTTCPDNWVTFSATAMNTALQGYADGAVNYGWQVRAASETDSYGWKRFYSANHGTYVPSLSVTYNTEPALPNVLSPASNTISTDTTPALSGRYSDADAGDTGWVAYEVYRDSDSVMVTSGHGASVASGTQSPWTVPGATLVNGVKYRWRARDWDGVDYSAYTGWMYYTPDTSGPTGALTAPAGGATLSGTFTATATPVDSPAGVTSTEFYATSNGRRILLGTDTSSTGGWSISADSTKVADGNAAITAEYVDAAGNRSSAASGASAGVVVDNSSAGAASWEASTDADELPAEVLGAGVVLDTGQLRGAQVDSRIKGRGADAAVTRYFDSRNKTVGLFGRGWHSSLEESVAQRPDGGVVHVDATGRERVFGATGTAAGLNTAFWNNMTLTGAPVATRVDGTVNYDWTTASPQAGVNTDAWSARWSGLITIPTAGTWTFYTSNDDGSVLTIDNAPVLTDWTAHAVVERTGTMSLAAGTHRIALEFFDNTSYAVEKLSWAGPGVAKAIVPATSLSHVTGYATPAGDHDAMTPAADGTVVLTDPAQATTTFDVDGHIAVVADANGNGIEHRWDANGSPQYVCFVNAQASTVCDATTSALAFTIDSSRRATAISGGGAAWSYTYDTSSRLATASGPTDTATFGYDTSNRLVSVTNGVSEVTQVTYDTSDRVTELRGPREVAAAVTGRTFTYGTGTVAVRSALSNATTGGGSTTYTLDSSGQATSVADPLGHSESATFDASHNQLTRTDALSHTTTKTYDSRGNVLTITNPSGNVTTNTYDSGNRPLTTTDPAGRTVTRTYDSRGNLLTEINPAGETTTYTYDAVGDRVTMVDPRATVSDAASYTTTWTYSSRGLKLTETDPMGGVRTWTYDTRGNVLTDKDQLNRTRTSTYDGNDEVLSETTHNGEKTTYTYNAALRRTTEVGPRGNVTGADPAIARTTTAYWPGGLLKSVTDALGQVTSHDYDADRNETSVTDPRLAVTASSYDLAGRLTSEVAPDTSVTSYTYDDAGRTTSTTTPSGTTTVTYDVDGNVLSQSGPGLDASSTPLKTTYTWDGSGLMLTTTAPAGNVSGATPGSYTTTKTYDAAGRLLTSTDPGDRTTTYTYDKAGNQTSIVNPAAATTTIAYDHDGRETSRTVPATARTTSTGTVASGATASTTVTATQAGTINAVLDWTETGSNLDLTLRDSTGALVASSSTTAATEVLTASVAAGTYTLNAVSVSGIGTYTLDRSVPSIGTSTTTYNAAGEVTSSGDAAGSTGFAYDAQGRVTSRTLPNSTTQTLVYDVDGRLSTMTTPAGTESYTYDNVGQLLTDTEPGGTVTTYTYDASGNQATITRGTTTTTRTFNSYSRMTSMSTGGTTSSYSYSGSGSVTNISYGSGDQDALTYDGNNLVTDIAYKASATATPWQVSHYDRDAQGNVTAVTDTTGTPVQLASFSYDAMDRLTGETTALSSGTRTASYGFDDAGNRTGKTVGTAVTAYTYDAAGQLVSRSGADGASTYLHDAAGRLVRITGADAATFTWDGENRLTGVTKGSTTASYTYDSLGRRASKTVNGVTTTYTYENERLLSQTTSGATTSFTHSDDAAPLTITTSAGTYNYHYDHHGSTVALTDSSHAVVVRYTYDAWGNVLAATGDSALIAVNPYTYLGRDRVVWDAESGTYLTGQRHYDPMLGRFTSRDPIAADDDLSAYVYATDNPATHSDPTGLLLPCSCTAWQPPPELHVSWHVFPWLRRNEGVRPLLYNDSGGKCTIGVGHLVRNGACTSDDHAMYPKPLTEAQMTSMLNKDVLKAEGIVKSYVKVTMKQRHLDALVSFVFNEGVGHFASSTLLVVLNQGHYTQVPYQLSRWNKGTINGVKQVLRGLVRRRCEEAHVWTYGNYDFAGC